MKIDDGNKLWEKKEEIPEDLIHYIHDEVWDLKYSDEDYYVAGTGDEYEYSENCEDFVNQINGMFI